MEQQTVSITDPATGRVLFCADELACRGTGALKLMPGFADRLLALRLAFGRPMIVTSGCRSLTYNAKVGGAKGSWHICDDARGGTAAIDIAWQSHAYAGDLMALAWRCGWSLGLKPGHFLHLDRRDLMGEPQTIFTY